MFSDKYKKEIDELTLDDDFLEKLKVNMKQERERLQQEKASEESSATHETEQINPSHQAANPWKHTLPVALTACAAIALIVLFPNIFSNFASKSNDAKCSSDMAYNMNFSTSESLESSAFEDSVTTDSKSDTGATTDSTTADTTTSMITSAEEKGDGSETSITTEAYVESEEESLDASTTQESDRTYAYACDVLYEDGVWSYTNNQEFIATSPDVLEGLQQVFCSNLKHEDAPIIDYADHKKLIFHDYYGLVIFDYDAREILRLVNLPVRIGDFTTTGDEALEVQLYNDGTYIVLDPHKSDEAGTSICYLYEVATDIMVQLSIDALSTLDLKTADTTQFIDSSNFASLMNINEASLQAVQYDETHQAILNYTAADDPTVSSLSIFDITSDNGSTSVITIPIFSK